ncbi:MAG: hypothetical protein AAFR27_10425 [Pseudomonadota bacterium]
MHKKKLKKLKAGLKSLGGYKQIISGAAKPALWAGYSAAISSVESIAEEGKTSKKTKRRHKQAIKAITKLAKHAGGKKALRVGKLPSKTGKMKKKPKVSPVVEPKIEEHAAIARLIGTPDEASNVVPLTAARVGNEDKTTAPGALKEPLDGAGDDLQLIAGVGPKLEQVLHGLGIWHYEQIAAWGPEEIAWVDEHLRFSGRIEREQWVAQAVALSRGGREEYIRVFGKEPR